MIEGLQMFLLAPAWTATAVAGWSAPECFPHPTLSRRELSIRPWKVASEKKAAADPASTKVTN